MTPSKMKDALQEKQIGPVRVLFGKRGGTYPDGNTLVIAGADETVLIDPALSCYERKPDLPAIDRVILSHCHEDHIAGAPLFKDLPLHVHRLDMPGLLSLEKMLEIYGYPEEVNSNFSQTLLERYHYEARPDAVSYEGGACFDLGGVTIRTLHTPGHTRGHSCLLVQWMEDNHPRNLIFLGDIELSGFGPYYGDAWSDLPAFEKTLKTIREVRADWYVTFHHVGVLEGHESFLARLDRFESAIERRELRLLDFIQQPRTLDEIIDYRIVYRPDDPRSPVSSAIESGHIRQHLRRLLKARRVRQVEGDRFLRV